MISINFIRSKGPLYIHHYIQIACINTTAANCEKYHGNIDSGQDYCSKSSHLPHISGDRNQEKNPTHTPAWMREHYHCVEHHLEKPGQFRHIYGGFTSALLTGLTPQGRKWALHFKTEENTFHELSSFH